MSTSSRGNEWAGPMSHPYDLSTARVARERGARAGDPDAHLPNASMNPHSRSLPFSATLTDSQLWEIHDSIPGALREWDLRPDQYKSLVANLPMTDAHRLSRKQHRRLSALIEVFRATSPHPLYCDGGRSHVLRHPRTAPCGTRCALDLMCSGLEGLEAMAAYVPTLPHGLWLLPDVLQVFLQFRYPDVGWFRELLEVAAESWWSEFGPVEDRLRDRDLVMKLLDEVLLAPSEVREDLLQELQESANPFLSEWSKARHSND